MAGKRVTISNWVVSEGFINKMTYEQRPKSRSQLCQSKRKFKICNKGKKKKDLQQGVHLTSSKVSKEENMAGVR